ncbi:MAG: exodeoxyribonuclease I [Patescibacteria group bacterium]|jgi:exodeoxyribonuclease-1|nr:exodeoxyribonuclease I [Patescibacteria group bacterium]
MVQETLYFYDLETSGVNPRADRIMQFAGQRTDLDLKPIGQPDNFLISLTDDILPVPEAILITSITPQQTRQDGISEKDFAKWFYKDVATLKTTILGYNSLRFDNEFIRFLMWRNFYDAYLWSYDQTSTWDILDTVRMTRALRPGGIEWPFSSEGKPTNRLEMLTYINKLEHNNAHDALSDVNATIAVAKLIKTNQPKLFSYLFDMRNKKAIQKLVNSETPFVYTSGRYPSETLHTTAVVRLSDHPSYNGGQVLVYDLRHNPEPFMSLTIEQLEERLKYTKDQNADPRLPVKALAFNKCPAVAPLAVLDKKAQKNINLTPDQINNNLKILYSDPTFVERIRQVFLRQKESHQQALLPNIYSVDGQLYDGFVSDKDKHFCQQIRESSATELADLHPAFGDERLTPLLLLYKARQMPKSLSEQEQAQWESYKNTKLTTGNDNSMLANYFKVIKQLYETTKDDSKQALLKDLWFWGESIAPADI